MDLFKVLGNEKRREMLRILANKDLHISGLGREVGISSPVALKHVNVLEAAQLVERIFVGNTAVIHIKEDTIHMIKKLEDLFEKPILIDATPGQTLYDVLKQLKGFEIRKWPRSNRHYIYAIDGQKGFYIYQVNGDMPNKAADEYVLKEDTVIEFQKLTPVLGRKIEIKMRTSS